MSLFGLKEKKEIELLKAQMPTQQLQIIDLNSELARVENQLENARNELQNVRQQLEIAKSQIVETDEVVLMQSFGFYTPHYSYTVSDEYKELIRNIRDQQKALIKSGKAVFSAHTWEVNGSLTTGAKMIGDMRKLFLRAFNAECDDAIEHVKFNNIDACKRKIIFSAEAICKLGKIINLEITGAYVQLKVQELHAVYEYQLKKQQEKEEERQIRAELREQAKLAKEIEAARLRISKEQKHYKNVLDKIDDQISHSAGADLDLLMEKRAETLKQICELEHAMKDVDYRAANQKAGYVYVISNIGSFGEGVYKIGMTRRLDPMDRINELGDASVPFRFDVHAMIFSEDAPKLEAALHRAFENKRLNMVNNRREFFRVSLEEIKNVIRENYDKVAEFVDIPDAEQYRQSLLMYNQQRTEQNGYGFSTN